MLKNIVLNSISSVKGNIKLPGSKSISNRVLLLSSLSKGITYIKNLLISDDIKYMLNALKILGVKIIFDKKKTECKIIGKGNPIKIKNFHTLFLGNAGTVMRPLLAVLSLKKNKLLLTGNKRMQERPIKHLVNALRQGGAIINYSNKKNFPPILLNGGFKGGKIILNGTISSQFLSALLIASPMAIKNTKIIIKGKLVSKPYIKMTLILMKKFGVYVENDNYKIFNIIGKQKYYTPGNYFIEGDASSASYFLAASAIKGGIVNVKGINKNSIQGDIFFSNILKKMGVSIIWKNNYIICIKKNIYSINLDLNSIPDAAMTVAIVSLFSKGTTIIKNIFNWRVKETDRLKAMSNELKKIGAIIIEGKDFISITSPNKFLYSKIETYDDHRIAMCFSLISLSNVKVKILNPSCVNKTFPMYFKFFNYICNFYK